LGSCCRDQRQFGVGRAPRRHLRQVVREPWTRSLERRARFSKARRKGRMLASRAARALAALSPRAEGALRAPGASPIEMAWRIPETSPGRALSAARAPRAFRACANAQTSLSRRGLSTAADMSGVPSSRVGIEIDSGIATVTLQDQKTRNCLSSEMMRDIIGTMETLEANKDVKVVVLTHTGKVFSSGHNLKELQLMQDTTGCTKAIFNLCNQLMLKIRSSRLPVVASVSGFATAAGCQLVATSDMCIASEGATFSTPGVNIGLFCHTPGVALGRAVGYKAAMGMLLTGDIMSAEQGLRAGLINEIVPEAELAARTRQIAEKIAGAPAAVMALGKETFYKQMACSELDQAYAAAGGVMTDNMKFPDAKEGLGAFIGKRPPKWVT